MMSSYEMEARLRELVSKGETCSTCRYQNQRTCKYAGEEYNIPILAGEPRCVDHTS